MQFCIYQSIVCANNKFTFIATYNMYRKSDIYVYTQLQAGQKCKQPNSVSSDLF